MLPVVAEAGVVHPLLRSNQHTDPTHDAIGARRALLAALVVGNQYRQCC